MSLFKQLLIAICLFLVVAFSGSFMVSLESSRTQYVNQLRSHAQDAATALALSLTPNIDDPAMVELLVSSIFDSGYYASIRVVDLATDKTIVERSGIPDNNGVPNWFVKLIGLEPAGGDALVSRGWEHRRAWRWSATRCSPWPNSGKAPWAAWVGCCCAGR